MTQKEAIIMKNTMTGKNRIRTRIIATALAAISVFSAGSAAMTSVSAATVSSVKVQSAASDGFFSGASALIGLIGKSNPLVGIISSGLLGAFKTIYHDATSTPQPSTQDTLTGTLTSGSLKSSETKYGSQLITFGVAVKWLRRFFVHYFFAFF